VITTTAPAGLGDDLARASLHLARRFAAGATLWSAAPAAPAHARHIAVEFVHPVIVGKRALPAVAVTAPDPIAVVRASVRAGDVVVAVGRGDDPVLAELARRAPAWGVSTIWLCAGPRPAAGAADHVVWLDGQDELVAAENFIRVYHLLWELAHVCFEHPGLLQPEPECEGEVCITCSDEGRLAEVVRVEGDEAWVRTAEGTERIDVAFIEPPRPGDLVLVHAGSAIAALDDPTAAPSGDSASATGEEVPR
jgi:hydrogenase maturation factor